MDSQTTLVYLDEVTAGKFVLFQKYFVPFTLLCDSKVFEQRAASITLKIDKDGTIQNIVRTDLLYSNLPNFLFINPTS